MKQLLNFIISKVADFLPAEQPLDLRYFTAKAILLALVIGYFASFLLNFLIRKLFLKFKAWLKEKRRDRRLAAKKIPGTIFLGEVTQFLDKLKVAVIKIKNKNLKTGDYIFIYGPKTKTTFQVNSLQINKQPVNLVKKGQEAGIMVPKEVHAGDLLYKLKKKPG